MKGRRWWHGFAARAHAGVSTVLLGALFYCLITPAGLLRRVLGNDPLGLRPCGDQSYWIERDPKAENSLRDQF